MIPKPVNMTSDNPRYDLFVGALEHMDEREFNWAKVHYENTARKWPTTSYLKRRDLVRADVARREEKQREQAA